MKQMMLIALIGLCLCIASTFAFEDFRLSKPVNPGNSADLNHGDKVTIRSQTDTSIVSPSGFFRIHFDTAGIDVPAYVIFLTFDDSNSVKISYDYRYHIVSSENENICVLYLINDQLTSVKEEPRHLGYQLFQNYPDPFNPSTTIRYQI